MTEENYVMKAAEVSASFRVHPRTVGRWGAAGKLPGFRTRGGHWRFHKRDVDALLTSQITRATPPGPAGKESAA